ncbi:MAG TPA: FAD-dependent monooxygenase, partial [Vicinamibacterales bacterium]|nr:FAD-dependent monooxygenase [Vicinamibacterales bacterium]
AHLMPPNGGYGGNTGIHDGHNLAWKLALVLKGIAGPRLLDTYEIERRPATAFTVEQAYTRYVTRTAPFLGKQDFQPLADDFDIELGYLYQSAAIAARPGDEVPSGVTHEHPKDSNGRPGSRAPHVWIDRDGEPVSTIDLFRGAFVLLAGKDGAPWLDGAWSAASDFGGLQLETHVVGENVTTAYGISASGASLVRPDGFVAWRAPSAAGDPAGELRRTFAAILDRRP